MEEFEPRKKIKIFTKEFYIKYSYVFIIALVLFLGTSFGLTFFTQNLKIATGSLTTAPLNITLSNNSINATGLSVPTTNQEGLSEFSKSLTITNNGTTDGIVKLTLDRTSGLNLTDMSYALIVNGAIQTIDDVPASGVILETAILGNEVIDVELRLWPKTSYSGNVTTFVGEIDSETRYFGSKASDKSGLTNAYVNFNCQGNNCETWRIVGTQSGRLILTRDEDLEGATNRTDSGKYNSSLTFNDNSMITSVSTDNKNVYLAKTVKIDSGEGTQANPYILINPVEREPDKKVISTITYKNGNNTVGTQYIYYNETNYISQELSDSGFQGWTDGTNDYVLGDTINFTSDTILTAKFKIMPNLTINAEDITYGDDLIITVSVSPSITGEVNVYDGSQLMGTASINDGSADVIVFDLNAGEYVFRVEFTPSNLETYSVASENINVSVEPYQILEDDISVIDYGNGTVSIIVPEGVDGSVTITINNNNFSEILENSVCSIQVNGVPSGVYNIIINLIPSSTNYKPIEITSRMTIP